MKMAQWLGGRRRLGDGGLCSLRPSPVPEAPSPHLVSSSKEHLVGVIPNLQMRKQRHTEIY